MLRVLVISSLLVSACSKKEAAPASGSGSGSGSGLAAPAAPVKKQPKPAPPEDRAGYRAGMAKGRKATDAKQYADAIKGFDAALAAKKGDPRALAERGYARFLEGSDLAAAARDLDRAWSGTKDTKLLSMIWFNRGLVEEKLGNQLNATAAFVVANTLRPTAAAQAKIAGKAACPVAVSHEIAVGSYFALDAPDWAALANKLPHEQDSPVETPTDKPPMIVRAGDWAEKVEYLVVPAGAGLRAIPLGVASGGRCPGTAEFEIAEADATHIHVTGSEMYEGGYTFMCTAKDGSLDECKGVDGEVGAGTACLGGTGDRVDVVFGVDGKVLLVTSQPDVDKPASLTLEPGGVKLGGLGCDRVEPLN